MNVVWQTDEGNRDATVAALRESGAEVRERMGFEPLTTIAAIAGVMALARALAKLFRDQWYRGVIVDLTKDPIEVRDMPGWDRHQVLVIGKDGPNFHSFDSEDQLTALITAANAT
jgi:hypothetical protein